MIIGNIAIGKNSNKAFDLLGKAPFPWFQFEIYKRRNGQITYIHLYFLNIIVIARRFSIEREVKKWLKQGYMPSWEKQKTAKIIKWPKDKGA